MPYIGSSAPNSAFAFPYGQAISRSTYTTLFALIGTTFGGGDGSTTFNLPDLRGRVIAGIDNMGGSNAARLTSIFNSQSMGGAGGAQNQAVTQGNLPNYGLPVSISDPGHAHVSIHGTGTILAGLGAQGANGFTNGTDRAGFFLNDSTNTSANTTGISVSVQLGGSGSALTTVPPTMVLNYILRII
jgi:microcystin-dependent protein